MGKTFCKGEHCPVKNKCLRYTTSQNGTAVGEDDSLINRCTNQKRYLRDYRTTKK